MLRVAYSAPALDSLLALVLLVLIGSYGCASPRTARYPEPADPTEQLSPQPAGDDIRALAVDGEGHLYAGTLGGLYRWEPDAASWRFLPSSEPAAVLTIRGTTLFAASGDGGNLHRVEQTGEEWTGLRDGLFDLMRSIGSPLKPLAVDSVLYLTTGGSFVRSFDGGRTWEHVLGEDQVPWRSSITGPSQPAVQGFRSALVQGPDGTIYVGLRVPSASGGPQPRIFRSRDGQEWTEVVPAPPHDPHFLVATSDGLRLQSMVNVEGEFRVTFRHFRLAPGADAWTEVALPDSMLQHLAVAGGRVYLFGQWRGFYRLDSSGEFEALDIPAAVNVVLEHDGRLYAGTNRGVFVSEEGYTWIPRNEGQRVDPDHVVGAGTGAWGWDGGATYYRPDDGQAWMARYRGLPPRPSIRGFAVGTDGPAWVVVSGRGLYEWRQDRWEMADSSTAMQRAYANRGSALILTADGTLLNGAIIMSSREDNPASVLYRRAGAAFEPVTELPGLPDRESIRRLTVDELTVGPDGTIIARVKADDEVYHYRSDDDGVTWTQFDGPE